MSTIISHHKDENVVLKSSLTKILHPIHHSHPWCLWFSILHTTEPPSTFQCPFHTNLLSLELAIALFLACVSFCVSSNLQSL